MFHCVANTHGATAQPIQSHPERTSTVRNGDEVVPDLRLVGDIALNHPSLHKSKRE